MEEVCKGLKRETLANNMILAYTAESMSADLLVYWSDDIYKQVSQTLKRQHLFLLDVSNKSVTLSYLVMSSRDLFNIGLTPFGRKRMELYWDTHPSLKAFVAVVLSDSLSGEVARNYNSNDPNSPIIGKVFFDRYLAMDWLINQEAYDQQMQTAKLNVFKFNSPLVNSLRVNMAQQAPTDFFLMINGAIERINLKGGDEILIGRGFKGQSNDVVDLSSYGRVSEAVSRKHASLSYMDGQIHITDLGSTNGTFVDNKRLEPFIPIPVTKASAIRLGNLDVNIIS